MFQRVRNRFTIFGVAGLVVGVGVSLVFSFAPNLVTESTARVLIYVGFGLMVLGVALFIYGFLKTPEQTKSELYNINPTLQKMHSPLLELAQKEKDKNIDWQKYLDFRQEINKGMFGIMIDGVKTPDGARASASKLGKSIQEQYDNKLAVGDFGKIDDDMWQISLLFDNRGYVSDLP